MTEVIFYRDHPNDPDNFRQIGRLYKFDKRTRRQIIGEYPKAWTWRKEDRHKIWGWIKKAEASNAPDAPKYIHIGDPKITLNDVVKGYREDQELCERTNGLFRIEDGSRNKIIIGALERSLPPNLEERTAEEQRVIREATRGGILFAQKGYTGQGYKYDITSCYPSVAASEVLFPIGKSEFTCVDEIDADSELPALYQVRVQGSSPFFRGPQAGETRWVTHVDIQIALDLGLEVELVGNPNCLRFEGSMPGQKLFGSFVHSLFKLKRQGVDGAKLVLNKTFGLLAKKQYQTYGKGCHKSVDQLPTDNGNEVFEIVPDDDGGHICKVIKLAKPFSYPKYCIFNCFVTAYARQRVVNLLLDHDCTDHVVHIHTDGWITTIPLDLPLSGELGGIKLEYTGQLTVHHVNRVRDKDNCKV